MIWFSPKEMDSHLKTIFDQILWVFATFSILSPEFKVDEGDK